jgi:uncharacterized protein (DUF2062 family)
MAKRQSKFLRFLEKFFTLDDTPRNIAAGAAVGLFMGILPIESISSSLIITTLLRVNRAAGLISVAASNVWVMVAVLPLAALSGGTLFGTSPAGLSNQFYKTYQSGWGYFFTKTSFYKFTLPLLVGYVIVGAIISLAFYFFLYAFLKNRSRLFLK